jgi:hypothetical protein
MWQQKKTETKEIRKNRQTFKKRAKRKKKKNTYVRN